MSTMYWEPLTPNSERVSVRSTKRERQGKCCHISFGRGTIYVGIAFHKLVFFKLALGATSNTPIVNTPPCKRVPTKTCHWDTSSNQSTIDPTQGGGRSRDARDPNMQEVYDRLLTGTVCPGVDGNYCTRDGYEAEGWKARENGEGSSSQQEHRLRRPLRRSLLPLFEESSRRRTRHHRAEIGVHGPYTYNYKESEAAHKHGVPPQGSRINRVSVWLGLPLHGDTFDAVVGPTIICEVEARGVKGIDLEDVKRTSALAFAWCNFRAVSRKVEKECLKAERSDRGRTLRHSKREGRGARE
ncbi:hypothetical protein BC826DRAFT_965832 [Russula brevipes]|nr:hypothetical protein BC826DRAFT_965832 [Russula brevipes]